MRDFIYRASPLTPTQPVSPDQVKDVLREKTVEEFIKEVEEQVETNLQNDLERVKRKVDNIVDSVVNLAERSKSELNQRIRLLEDKLRNGSLQLQQKEELEKEKTLLEGNLEEHKKHINLITLENMELNKDITLLKKALSGMPEKITEHTQQQMNQLGSTQDSLKNENYFPEDSSPEETPRKNLNSEKGFGSPSLVKQAAAYIDEYKTPPPTTGPGHAIFDMPTLSPGALPPSETPQYVTQYSERGNQAGPSAQGGGDSSGRS